jgi:hypothetical protein
MVLNMPTCIECITTIRKATKATLDTINDVRRLLRQRLRQATETTDTCTIERGGFNDIDDIVISVIILHLLTPQPAAAS